MFREDPPEGMTGDTIDRDEETIYYIANLNVPLFDISESELKNFCRGCIDEGLSIIRDTDRDKWSASFDLKRIVEEEDLVEDIKDNMTSDIRDIYGFLNAELKKGSRSWDLPID